MTYYAELLRRHYEALEREHAKLSEEEAARTRIEGMNARYIAELMHLGVIRADHQYMELAISGRLKAKRASQRLS